jgi:hypothetical protein
MSVARNVSVRLSNALVLPYQMNLFARQSVVVPNRSVLSLRIHENAPFAPTTRSASPTWSNRVISVSKRSCTPRRPT